MKVYDITNVENALHTLTNLFNLSFKEVDEFMRLHQNVDVEAFLKEFHINLDCFELEDLQIVGIHTTTNNDQCESIKKTGLINLKRALSLNSSLNNFLHEHDIYINIYTKTLTYKQQSYNLVDCGNSKLHYKIFGDYALDCFLVMQKNRKFDAKLKARPKVLSEIEKYLHIENLHQEWINQSTPYMIKFKEHAYNFNRYHFSPDGSEDGMKYTLVHYALTVIATNQECDIQVDLVGEYQIPVKNIIEINAVEV